MDVTHWFSQSSQQKPGTEIGLCQQIHCWFELKKTKKVGWNEVGLLNFLESTERDHRIIQLQMCTMFQGKGKITLKAIQRSSGLPLPPYAQGGKSISSLVPKGGAEGIRPPLRALWVMLPHQWAWITEHQIKEDYSWALKSTEICLFRFWTCLGSITPSFLLIHILSKFNAEWNTSFHLNQIASCACISRQGV